MDKLIEDYKNELINDNNGGYGYPSGLKNNIIKDVDNNNFTIPVKKVQEMIENIRRENSNKNNQQLNKYDISHILLSFCDYLEQSTNIKPFVYKDKIINRFIRTNYSD